MLNYMIVLIVSFLVAIAALPISRKIAFLINAVDGSSDCLQMHNKPIPLLGGLAIFLGILASFLISISQMPHEHIFIWGFLTASIIIMSIGLIDDVISIRQSYKLYIQIALAVGMVCIGMRTQFFASPFISVPLTIFYVVGSCNAWNLLDGLDGLASGIAAIAALGYFVLFMAAQDMFGIVLSLALLGANIGFLTRNFNPASIFMGDTGSMMLGLAFAVLMIRYSAPSSYQSFCIPILICGVPVFDTALTYMRRWVNHKPILPGDRGHFYDRLIARGYSVKQTVCISYVLAALFCISGISMLNLSFSGAILFSAVLVLILSIAISKMKILEDIYSH